MALFIRAAMMAILLIVASCKFEMNKLWKHDNIAEEVAEEIVGKIIEKKTGIELDLDFSPSTPEDEDCDCCNDEKDSDEN